MTASEKRFTAWMISDVIDFVPSYEVFEILRVKFGSKTSYSRSEFAITLNYFSHRPAKII